MDGTSSAWLFRLDFSMRSSPQNHPTWRASHEDVWPDARGAFRRRGGRHFFSFFSLSEIQSEEGGEKQREVKKPALFFTSALCSSFLASTPRRRTALPLAQLDYQFLIHFSFLTDGYKCDVQKCVRYLVHSSEYPPSCSSSRRRRREKYDEAGLPLPLPLLFLIPLTLPPL